MEEITLKCCTCGEEIYVTCSRPPMFGFELYDIGEKAGWHPVIDFNYNRTLMFCSEECMKKQLTKGGYIRYRLIKAEKKGAVTDGEDKG